ncbi:MAG: NAD(P)/FAD-dependent oxidoreductase [Gemmatimonadetes bacterium]|nr:NAD(P)/FAD-dependent oxidoreductase [Gemmatimonadota bacterium]
MAVDDGGGIKVDRTLSTTAKGIWAVGDVTGGLQFTHVAEHMARGALQNSLSPLARRISYDAVPWVTYTDPEVAHVGLTEVEANRKDGTTYRYDFQDLDRAIADGKTDGFVKISADRKGKILGATIVGHGAGELILPLVMALQHGLGMSELAGTIFPYPTMAEGVKRAANEYMRGRLDSTGGRLLKKVIQWMK